MYGNDLDESGVGGTFGGTPFLVKPFALLNKTAPHSLSSRNTY